MSTVASDLSRNFIYPTLCCDSPSLHCTQFYLIYPTPGLSDTFMGNRHCEINQIPLYVTGLGCHRLLKSTQLKTVVIAVFCPSLYV